MSIFLLCSLHIYVCIYNEQKWIYNIMIYTYIYIQFFVVIMNLFLVYDDFFQMINKDIVKYLNINRVCLYCFRQDENSKVIYKFFKLKRFFIF